MANKIFLSSLCYLLAKVNLLKLIKFYVSVSLEVTSLLSQFTEYRWRAIFQTATNVQSWKKCSLIITL